MIDLRPLARALGGEGTRTQARVPGVGHSREDRSVSISVDLRAPDGFLVHCFGSGDPIVEKDRIRNLLGIPRPDRERCDLRPAVAEKATVANELEDIERTAGALSIWHESGGPYGTPVETYLARRGLFLPPEAAVAVRFHPRCPFAGRRTPAMVCLVRDIRTNQAKAIHRTALSVDGNKVKIDGKDRLALGPLAGGAIKISPEESITYALGVGEGVESSLSLQRVPEFGPTPVWSLISAGGVAGFPVLPELQSLWLAVDHDPVGLKATQVCANRWRVAGAEAFLVTPSAPRADLNDLFAGAPNA